LSDQPHRFNEISLNKLRSPYAWLVLILVVYLTVGALYAVYTPPWQVPDEPAHYNYIHALASTGQFPIIEMGDYDQTYLTRLVFEERFSPDLSIAPLTYEDWQPPLYYALAVPVFLLTGGSLIALRLFSVLLGAGVVVFAFLIARQVFPRHPIAALGTAAFVACVPQHVAMMAGVNNDSLAELLMAAVMFRVFQISNFRFQISNWGIVGVLLGFGLVTKLSFYIAVPLVAWALIRRLTADGGRRSAVSSQSSNALVAKQKWSPISQSVLVLVPALLIALPWWARNIAVYGWPDFMGQLRHNAVVVGQPTSAWWIEQYGWGDLLRRFFTFTFQSFWGQFGWMTVPMAPRYYWVLGILSLVALIGFIGAAWPRRKYLITNTHFQLLGAWVLLNVLMYLYYNLMFVQHQGRYLFLALVPIGLAFTVGLRQWTLLLPRAWRSAALVLPYLGLVMLDLLALFRMIVPSLQ